MKLIQEPKIATQIIKALDGHEGNITINFNMNATQVGLDQEQQEATYTPQPEELDLLALIDNYPPPRLRNFINHIYFLADEKFNGKKKEAGKWLGVSERTLYRLKWVERLLLE